MTHTPGPWHTVAKVSIADSNDYGICEAATSNKTQEERYANACLIAAAPELLEALKSMVGRFGGTATVQLDRNALKEARDAIEKATTK